MTISVSQKDTMLLKQKWTLSNRFTQIYAICILMSLLVDQDMTMKSYVFFAIYMVISVVTTLRIPFSGRIPDVIPLSYLGVHVYGLIMGLLNQNDISFIIANFAGIVLYSQYYMLRSNDCLLLLKRTIVTLSYFYVFLTFVSWIDYHILGIGVTRKIPIVNSYIWYPGIQYFSRDIVFCAYLYSLHSVVHRRKWKLLHVLIIGLVWFETIYIMKLTGEMLAVMLITILYVVSYLCKVFGKTVLTLLAITMIVASVFLASYVEHLVIKSGDVGDMIRIEEIEYFLREITFFGKGLGARVEVWGTQYGSEMIYLNIFHKYGIVALVIIFGYMYSLYASVMLVSHSKGDPMDTVPLGCMAFLFPALGNPSLFAPISVLLHCVALLGISEMGVTK